MTLELNKIHQGDMLELVDQIDPNSIDTIIADPPYHLKSINKRFSSTSLNDDNQTGRDAKGKTKPHARLSRGFMGQEWDGGEIAFDPETWAKLWRVAKPGGILIAFGGSRTHHRMACAIEDAGWEVRDTIEYFYDPEGKLCDFLNSLSADQLDAYLELEHPGWIMSWIYGQGFHGAKSSNISKLIDKKFGKKGQLIERIQQTGAKFKVAQRLIDNGGFNDPGRGSFEVVGPATSSAKRWCGYGTGLKPAVEVLVVAQKPREGTYADNAIKWGVAGFDIEGNLITTGEPWSWGTQTDIKGGGYANKRPSDGHVYAKNVTGGADGRKPANFIHDGSNEVMLLFDKAGARKAGGSVSGNEPSSKTKTGYGKFANNSSHISHDDSGSAARFFYCAKPAIREKIEGWQYLPRSKKVNRRRYEDELGLWEPRAKSFMNSHPTRKPLSLVEHLCQLTRTPTGGIVLDAFAGTGTTGKACVEADRDFILIEQSKAYCTIAKAGLEQAHQKQNNVVEIETKEGETISAQQTSF